MEPLTAVGLIIAVFLLLALFIAQVDGLAFMAPKSTRAMRGAATNYCLDKCRIDGVCPLTGTTDQAADCPLFGFVRADVPTVVYGNPFERTQS